MLRSRGIDEHGASRLEITRMRRRHLRGVMAIERQVYARPWSPNLFVAEMSEPSNRCYLVARSDKTIVGYGAPAKGNTLLNYCGINTDIIDYTVDLAPSKQNFLLPGSRIPIYSPGKIRETRPDYVFILPWNIKDEIIASLPQVFAWGGDFATAVPEIRVYRHAV